MKHTYVYEVEMLKLSDKIEIIVDADNENARDAFFKKFLENKDERFFFDKNTQKGYNKDYIYGYIIKGVK